MVFIDVHLFTPLFTVTHPNISLIVYVTGSQQSVYVSVGDVHYNDWTPVGRLLCINDMIIWLQGGLHSADQCHDARSDNKPTSRLTTHSLTTFQRHYTPTFQRHDTPTFQRHDARFDNSPTSWRALWQQNNVTKHVWRQTTCSFAEQISQAWTWRSFADETTRERWRKKTSQFQLEHT